MLNIATAFFMMNTLHSKWRDPRIEICRLDLLTPMDVHGDDRYLTRDLPRIRSQGLWYPLLVYSVTEHWWHNKYLSWRPKSLKPVIPTVDRDGKILAVKMGSNRYQCARDLGYEAVDIIVCNSSDECVKLGKWYAQCDPLNNINPIEYQGLFDYPNQVERAQCSNMK